MNSKKVCRNLLVLATLGSVCGLAFSAGTGSATFGVAASVASNCLISATPMNFNTYDPTSPSDNIATSTVSVKCSKNSLVTVALDKGTTAGATENSRMMVLANNDNMNYGLYSDTTRVANWGTTAGAQSTTGTGLATAVDLTVYGKIPKYQYTVGVGNYSDLITATVTY